MILLIGTVTAMLTATRALPQLLRLFTGRGDAGVSLPAAAIVALVFLPWAVHATQTGDLPILGAMTVGGAAYLGIVIVLLCRRRHVRELTLPAAVALVGGALWATVGLEAVLLLTFIAPVVYGIPQIRDAVRAVNTDAVAASTFLLASVEVGLWVVYATATANLWFAGHNLLALLAHFPTLVIVIARRSWRHGRPPLAT